MSCSKQFFPVLAFFLFFLFSISYTVQLETTAEKNNKIILGFSTNSSTCSITSYSSIISHLATVTYAADGFGYLSGKPPAEQIKFAKQNGIKPIALVNNNFDANISKLILESERNSSALIDNIFFELRFYNYSGVNIDFEGIYPQDRDYFTFFIKALYEKLHPKGYTVSIDVPAKTFEDNKNWWSGAYDYAQLSKYCDFIVVMAYDEHYSKGDHGPIASFDWFKKVVNYASQTIPKEKLVLGLAAYGYDWSTTTSKAFGISSMNSLAANNASEVKFDTASLSPYFEYTDSLSAKHKVWFENSESISYKLDYINKEELAGIAIWRLGLEDCAYLNVVKAKLTDTKQNTSYLVDNLKLLQPKTEPTGFALKKKKGSKTVATLTLQEKKKKL